MERKSAIFLCMAVASLVAIGLVMLASTSVWAAQTGADRYYFLKRQIIMVALGGGAACFFCFINYRVWRKWWILMLLGICGLLSLCYVPGLGVSVNGDFRWITLGGFRFQPSEVSKAVIIISLAAWFTQYEAEAGSFWRGYVVPCLLLGVPTALILFEKDLGTSLCLGIAGLAIMFVAGTRIWLLVLSVAAAGVGLFAFVRSDPVRLQRITAFMDLDKYAMTTGWQQKRALEAFLHGGPTGMGLGNGAEKHGALPEAHTDFIFAMIGEELGLAFTLGTVFCFVIVCVAGIGIALHAPDRFGRLLGFGLTIIIAVPALINMGVTTAMLPVTGLPLPFVSYGGTSLVFMLAAVGLLLSLHRHAIFADRSKMPIIKKKKMALKM